MEGMVEESSGDIELFGWENFLSLYPRSQIPSEVSIL